MREKTPFIFFITIISTLAWALAGQAADLRDKLQEDFSPVEAMVSKAAEGMVFLDAGASRHVSKGDLFSIFRKGEPLYLPGSKVILGYQRKKIAVCRVMEVGKDSSECVLLSRQMPPRQGDAAVRFGELNAAFFVEGRAVEPGLPEGSLKDILPWFKWLEPSAQPSPVATPESMKAFGIDILFEVQGDTLQVFGPDMKKFKSYQLAPSFVFMNQEALPAQAKDIEKEAGIQRKEVFDFSKAELVGSLDREVIQANISDLDGDGRLEIIYLLKHQLCIAPYRRQGRVVSLKFVDFSHLCSFSLLENKGWLCLNAALDQAGLSSKLLKYHDGTISLIQDQINLWLGFLDTDCDGRKDALFGQTYERARFRGRKIFRLAATDSGIEYVEEADYPADFNVNSAASADIQGRGCFLFYVSFDGFFKAYGNERHLWSSLKPVVRDTECCGPARADLIDLSRTSLEEPGIIFNGIMFLPKARLRDSLLLFLQDKDASALYQADMNLKGRVCSISLAGNQIIMAEIVKNQKTGKNETLLVAFPKSP